MSNKEQERKSSIQEESHLEYIQIDHKNKVEELSSEDHIILVSNLLKSLNKIEDNIGGEINKVFQNILQETKETDPLKLMINLSSKIKILVNHSFAVFVMTF